MDCPSQSPDLNLIENAWALLKRRLLDRSTHPTNADDLFQILCNMWNDIPHHHFTSLVHSKPCWATLVLRNKGQSIKYCVSNTKSEIEKNLPGFWVINLDWVKKLLFSVLLFWSCTVESLWRPCIFVFANTPEVNHTVPIHSDEGQMIMCCYTRRRSFPGAVNYENQS